MFSCLLAGLLAGVPVTWLAGRLPAAFDPAQPGRRPAAVQQARSRYRGLLRYLLISAALILALPTLSGSCALPTTLAELARVLQASLFVLIIVIDLEHRRIPQVVLLPTLLLTLLLALDTDSLSLALPGALAGFLLGGLIFAGGGLYRRAHLHFRGTRLDAVPFGAGDVLLAGLCGLVAGWPLILPALLTAIVCAGIAALLLLLAGRVSIHSSLPYAPFLLGGTILVMRFPGTAALFLASIG